MLQTKLIIRVLDADGHLLGWAEACGDARGDGALWVDPVPGVLIDEPGTPAWLSVHWCDVNVEVRSQLVAPAAKAGDTITPQWNGPALVVGPAAGGLPPVTVRQSIAIGVPAGQLGAVAH